MEWFVTHLQGSDHVHGLLGSLDRNEMCSKGGDKVVPGAVVDSIRLKGSVLPILGPFSCGHSHFEVGKGGSDLLGVVTVKVIVQIIIALVGTEKVFCFCCNNII
jgi:hypothetical protein